MTPGVAAGAPRAAASGSPRAALDPLVLLALPLLFGAALLWIPGPDDPPPPTLPSAAGVRGASSAAAYGRAADALRAGDDAAAREALAEAARPDAPPLVVMPGGPDARAYAGQTPSTDLYALSAAVRDRAGALAEAGDVAAARAWHDRLPLLAGRVAATPIPTWDAGLLAPCIDRDAALAARRIAGARGDAAGAAAHAARAAALAAWRARAMVRVAAARAQAPAPGAIDAGAHAESQARAAEEILAAYRRARPALLRGEAHQNTPESPRRNPAKVR